VNPSSSTSPEFDVIVVGAGFAGAAAATVMGRDQLRVALIDPRREYPREFKAEKIEPDHADALRRLDLADRLLPCAARIRAVVEAHDGRVLRVRPIEQYGMRYEEMVRALRRQIPSNVDFRIGRVARIVTSADRQSVTLDTGLTLHARLVVMAAGTGPQVEALLGAHRRRIRSRHSVCIGFDIAPPSGGRFPFDAVTYWTNSMNNGIDFVSLFVVPGCMRVNIFGYLEPRDPWLRSVVTDPRHAVEHMVPRMTRVVGEWRAISRVDIRAIDLFVADSPPADGIVLIGDACQSACPATGTGLGKVMTDVEVLCRTHVRAWLDTPGMTADKIAAYYRDARKTASDGSSLYDAEYRRQLTTDRSFRWRVHRTASYARLALSGLLQR
jgi:2-polyprenyl-6-methoxyphenol hydroxylase-like FAD-dependent oxidoreductase